MMGDVAKGPRGYIKGVPNSQSWNKLNKTKWYWIITPNMKNIYESILKEIMIQEINKWGEQ